MESKNEVGILGIGMAVPERKLTNSDLEVMVNTTDEWIVTRTGIRERRIAEPGTNASHLATAAARQALQDAGLVPEDIDLIVCATISGDMLFPATSCLVQRNLGIKNAPAFDLQAGCSGFIYGLDVARAMLRQGRYRNALVMGVEMLSRVTDWSDRSTCVLFGDGAGAAVIGTVTDENKGHRLLEAVLGADGSGWDLIYLPAGGSAMPSSEETVRDRLHFLKMEGRQVFKFATRILQEATLEVLEREGLAVSDIKCFIPHQANSRIVDYAALKLGLDEGVMFSNLEKYGNTSAASIPIALAEAASTGRIVEGDLVVMVGFGSGLTWGAMLVRW